MNDITAIILTKNEEVNIERCIKSIVGLADRIVVVDSGSTDKTVEIARSLGAEIYTHPFINHGKQFNWALDNIDIQSTWVFRLDADEVMTPELYEEIITECKKHTKDDVNAFEMRFKVYFLGKFLKHGGTYPFCKINIFKKDKARFNECPLGDDVKLLDGKYIQLTNDCLHYDFKSLSSYVKKHDWYADMEVDVYCNELGNKLYETNISKVAQLRKSTKMNIYYKLPLFWRARFYYWFRYYFQLGFLDGTPGRVYAFIQAYWYRYLIDAKIYEKQVQSHEKHQA